MNVPQAIDRLVDRAPLPPGVLAVLALGAFGTLRLLDVAVVGGASAPVAGFFLLAAAGLQLAVLAGLLRELSWGWYGTIVCQMLWTLEAAARYDLLAVGLYFLAVTYLYDHADRYVDIEEFALFRASA